MMKRHLRTIATETMTVDGLKIGVVLKPDQVLDETTIGQVKTSTCKVYEVLLDQFSRLGGIKSGMGGIKIVVDIGYTKVTVGLNNHKGGYFVNFEGNPISFLTGQNTFGTTNLKSLMYDFFDGVEQGVANKIDNFKFPKEVKDKFRVLDLFLWEITFAFYSQKGTSTGHLKKLLYNIYQLYAAEAQVGNAGVIARDLVGISAELHGEVGLLIRKRTHEHKEWTLTLYDKLKELEDKGITLPESGTVQKMENRYRFDLKLHKFWLSHNRKIHTLADLETKFGGDPRAWVVGGFSEFLDRIGLRSMFSCPVNFSVLKTKHLLSYKLWLKGKKFTSEPDDQKMIKFFLLYGVDIRLPARFYSITSHARLSKRCPIDTIEYMQDTWDFKPMSDMMLKRAQVMVNNYSNDSTLKLLSIDTEWLHEG